MSSMSSSAGTPPISVSGNLQVTVNGEPADLLVTPIAKSGITRRLDIAANNEMYESMTFCLAGSSLAATIPKMPHPLLKGLAAVGAAGQIGICMYRQGRIMSR